ncbi:MULTISPECIES: hypothetical protein [unclassified Ruegeria]|uniref:hypothetical protein n=1 Tax=unclassified Ruegeria TaxID=2625375 RepID=UPI0014881C92|nr:MULTISPECIES: hypothetical protein [unclassified Ruegeria]
MSQIEELQRRIIVAMHRIGTGVDALAEATLESSGSDEGLRATLDQERQLTAELHERIKTLETRHQSEIDNLRTELERAEGEPEKDPEMDVLRKQLAEAKTTLASVEAARAELAEAKAALDNTEEVDGLKAEIAQLKAELADSERIEELSAELEMLRAERSSHGAAMSRLDDDLQRMRKANEQLRASMDELRAAAQNGLPDAALLNRATAAELEATRAAQATDAAEAHAVLARLEPLLSRAQLTEGEVE